MHKQYVGIDDMALYIPSVYFPIEALAEVRDIEVEKLRRGLGLEKMAIPDAHEDAATMAANAVVEIIDKNGLDPRSIGRIYLGTESALDGAKPTATYVLDMLNTKYKQAFGENCLLNCDVVDLTFACVGGVDALHNTLDWVRGDENRIGIVVTSDFAKYELASTGEYTQGAGAVALLIKHHPRLMVIHDTVGVATMPAHDFFKPRRKFNKLQIIDEVLALIGRNGVQAEDLLKRLPTSLQVSGLLDDNDADVMLYKDTPVYDGPYSNLTYQKRIREAYEHFRTQATQKKDWTSTDSVFDRWSRIIFHLPYAFHGKRIFSEVYMDELKRLGLWDETQANLGMEQPVATDFETPEAFEKAYGKFLRLITKTDAYRTFVKEKIEKGQRASSEVGNMYACSIFLALMSTLEADLEDKTALTNQHFGFFGYGSGSKSKVFEATIQGGWQEIVQQFKVQQKLQQRQALTYEQYEQLHKGALEESVIPATHTFAIHKIGDSGTQLGARYYQWVDADQSKINSLEYEARAKG